jgi:hypothetical protein
MRLNQIAEQTLSWSWFWSFFQVRDTTIVAYVHTRSVCTVGKARTAETVATHKTAAKVARKAGECGTDGICAFGTS